MTVFCTLQDVKTHKSGDQPVESGAYDQTIINTIADVGDGFDTEIARSRGEGEGWSFLAPAIYGIQVVTISGYPVSGTFTLTLGALTTAAIAYSATAAIVQAALNAVLSAGTTVVTGAPGGPWTVTFAGALSGPQSIMLATDSFTPTSANAVVQEIIHGAPALTQTRRYSGSGSRLILIDDAVSVSSVSLLNPNGSLSQTLTAGTDYLPAPLNGMPIIGLTKVCGYWPGNLPGGVSVTLVPGYATSIPTRLRKASIDEVIRGIRGDQAGLDDRVGTQPFGQQTVTRAFLAETYRALSYYRLGEGLMRRHN